MTIQAKETMSKPKTHPYLKEGDYEILFDVMRKRYANNEVFQERFRINADLDKQTKTPMDSHYPNIRKA